MSFTSDDESHTFAFTALILYKPFRYNDESHPQCVHFNSH